MVCSLLPRIFQCLCHDHFYGLLEICKNCLGGSWFGLSPLVTQTTRGNDAISTTCTENAYPRQSTAYIPKSAI